MASDDEEYGTDFEEETPVKKQPPPPSGKPSKRSHQKRKPPPPSKPSPLQLEIERLNDELKAQKSLHSKTQIARRHERVETQSQILQLTNQLESAGFKGNAKELESNMQSKMTERLVESAKKNFILAQKYATLKEQLADKTKSLTEVRRTLVQRIAGSGNKPSTPGEHVKISDLFNLYAQRIEAGMGSGVGSAAEMATSNAVAPDALHTAALEKKVSDLKTHNRQLTAQVQKAQQRVEKADAQQTQLQTYAKMSQGFAEKLGREKELRIRSEKELARANEKIVRLSEHIEKLMVHLKHESTNKLKSQKTAKALEREVKALTSRTAALAAKNSARERVISELREGSKILEDQLRLMDKKYIELRSKLDWTRNHSKLQVKKMQKEANALRAKWALAGGLDLELLARQAQKKGGSKQLAALVGHVAKKRTKGEKLDPLSSTAPAVVVSSKSKSKKHAKSNVVLPPFLSGASGPATDSSNVDASMPWSSQKIGMLKADLKRN